MDESSYTTGYRDGLESALVLVKKILGKAIDESANWSAVSPKDIAIPEPLDPLGYTRGDDCKPCACHEEIATLRKAVKDTWAEGYRIGRKDTIKEIAELIGGMAIAT